MSFRLIISLTPFMFIALTACKKEEPPSDETSLVPEIVVETKKEENNNSVHRSKKHYVLGRKLNEIDLRHFDYFGDFFGGRAKFFTNYEQPVNIGNGQSESMLLCFLDDDLSKIKYRMNEDIGPFLLSRLGKCKIRGLDSLTTVRIKQGSFIHVSDTGFVISEDLKYYQLRWERDDLEARYVVKKNLIDEKPLFAYEERITDYKETMLYLERYRGLPLPVDNMDQLQEMME